MSMTEPTAGPWTIDGPNKNGSWEVRNRDFVICSRNPVHHLANQSGMNAYLVGAAPDLLAALQSMSEARPDQPIGAWFGVIRTAIAKAQGRS
jgi:hypothetical protein